MYLRCFDFSSVWESLLYVQVAPLPAFTVFIPHRYLTRCDWKWNNINQGYSSCIHPSIQPPPSPQSKDMHVQVKFEVDAGASVHAWLSHYLSLQSDNAWFMCTEGGWVTFSYWIWFVCVELLRMNEQIKLTSSPNIWLDHLSLHLIKHVMIDQLKVMKKHKNMGN